METPLQKSPTAETLNALMFGQEFNQNLMNLLDTHHQESDQTKFFGDINLQVVSTKNMRTIEVLPKANFTLTVVYPNSTVPAFKKIVKPMTEEVSLLNITEEAYIEMQFNLPGKIPLLSMQNNFGVLKLSVKDLLEKNQSKDQASEVNWFPVQYFPDNSLNVPQIQLKYSIKQKTSLCENDFTFEKLLGRGKYGKVWLVKEKTTGKLYALKTIRKQDLNEQKKEIRNTLVERLILSTIRHPFIISLKFAFQNEGLDFIPGGDFHHHMHVRRAIHRNEEMVKFYSAQLLLAIGHLHDHNILMRDLKPENCLLDSTGYVYLTDFGLAKISEDHKNSHSLCGTPDYFAPEMLRNYKTCGYDERIDFWSLGCIMYEMFYGCSPFRGSSQTELFRSILNEQVAFDNTMPFALVSLITGLLAKNPRERLCFEDIKNHDFFEGMDWNALMRKELVPPYKPKIKRGIDTKYFEKEFTSQRLEDSVPLLTLPSATQSKFMNFDFINTQCLEECAKY